MKKLLSITLVLVMLLGFGAIAVSADDAVLEAQASEAQLILDMVGKINDARNALSNEKRTALDKKFCEKYDVLLPQLANYYDRFDFYAFWLTLWVPMDTWKAVEASTFQIILQFFKFIVSIALRYIFFGFLWMPPF